MFPSSVEGASSVEGGKEHFLRKGLPLHMPQRITDAQWMVLHTSRVAARSPGAILLFHIQIEWLIQSCSRFSLAFGSSIYDRIYFCQYVLFL